MLRAFLFLILLAISSAVGWSIYQQSALVAAVTEKKPPRRKLTVEAIQPAYAPVKKTVELAGSLTPSASVEIRSRTTGYIQQLPYEVGQSVKSDELLVGLDKSAQLELLSRAEAALKIAKAELKAQVNRRELVEKELNRLIQLYDEGASTSQQIEQQQGELLIAVAEQELQQAKMESAQSDVITQQLQLTELEINAPMSGVIAQRPVELGTLAQPNMALMTLMDIDTVNTVVHVIEQDYPEVHQGQQAEVRIDAIPNRTFRGEVLRIAPTLSPLTRTAAVEIKIENFDHALKPGMHARVNLTLQQKEKALVIPVGSLISLNEQASVMVVDKQTKVLKKQPVILGIQSGNLAEITQGVEKGDWVVSLGHRLANDGQEIELLTSDWQPSTQNQPSPTQPGHAAD